MRRANMWALRSVPKYLNFLTLCQIGVAWVMPGPTGNLALVKTFACHLVVASHEMFLAMSLDLPNYRSSQAPSLEPVTGPR